MRPLVLFACLFFAASAASPWAFSLETQLKGVQCATEAQALLDQWDGHHDWRRQINDNDNATVYLTPTQEIGVWLETHVYPDNTVAAFKTTPNGVLRVVWNSSNCAATISVQEKPKGSNRVASGGGFGDDELAKIVASNSSGVIYAWSPLMNYSMKGLAEIKRAADSLHIKLVTVLDPNFKKSRSLASNSKPIESLELVNQGLVQHYPAILVFSKGKIVGRVYSGYRDESTYRKFIKEQLAK
jgi:hypothetical protein